jgi:hypothetical protein
MSRKLMQGGRYKIPPPKIAKPAASLATGFVLSRPENFLDKPHRLCYIA